MKDESALCRAIAVNMVYSPSVFTSVSVGLVNITHGRAGLGLYLVNTDSYFSVCLRNYQVGDHHITSTTSANK